METTKRVLIVNNRFGQGDIKDIPHPGVEITIVPENGRQQLLDLIPDYDAYITSLKVRVDREVLDRARRLKVIGTPSTGTDHLELELLEERGITVQSTKEDRQLLDQFTTTAELAFGLLITCARHLPLCFEASREGRWVREKLAGRQLREKTLGIIGMGRLGTMMARYGQAFWMRVIGYDPNHDQFPYGAERVDLPTLLRESDFVTLHVHLTEKTENMLGAKELAMMQQGSSLINTSRGKLIDEAALIREMEGGRIAAAGLDVIDGEWQENIYDHPLIAYSRKNPRLYITPHVGGTSPEPGRMSMRHTVQKVLKFLEEPGA